MKILVCISCVPDTTAKISVNSNNFLDIVGLVYIVGPYDDYALSRAIELKETNGAEITVIHVGPQESDPLIKKCLALGADFAVRIDGIAEESQQVAHEIANYAQSKSFDLILMGKESIDYNNGIVHSLVASKLDYSHFSPVMKLDILDNKALIDVEISSGRASIEVEMPLVLGCQEPIAEWKIPSMRGIMQARSKEIEILPFSAKTIGNYSKMTIVESARKGIMIPSDQAEQLIDMLQSELK